VASRLKALDWPHEQSVGMTPEAVVSAGAADSAGAWSLEHGLHARLRYQYFGRLVFLLASPSTKKYGAEYGNKCQCQILAGLGSPCKLLMLSSVNSNPCCARRYLGFQFPVVAGGVR
jgi:hypothetical protein